MKTYYQKHKEEIREYQRKYNQEHKEEIKKYRQEHKEEIRRYYQEHKDEIKEHQKKYYQEHKDEIRRYYQEHKEEIKKYCQEHKEEIKEYRKKRKIGKPYKKQGDFLKDKLEDLNKNQSWLARELGITRESVSKYTQGIYFPKEIEKRKKLCRILKIKVSDLEKLVENKNVKS